MPIRLVTKFSKGDDFLGCVPAKYEEGFRRHLESQGIADFEERNTLIITLDPMDPENGFWLLEAAQRAEAEKKEKKI